jgi:hypothetical protein
VYTPSIRPGRERRRYRYRERDKGSQKGGARELELDQLGAASRYLGVKKIKPKFNSRYARCCCSRQSPSISRFQGQLWPNWGVAFQCGVEFDAGRLFGTRRLGAKLALLALLRYLAAVVGAHLKMKKDAPAESSFSVPTRRAERERPLEHVTMPFWPAMDHWLAGPLLSRRDWTFLTPLCLHAECWGGHRCY